jgi:hypothetical protein
MGNRLRQIWLLLWKSIFRILVHSTENSSGLVGISEVTDCIVANTAMDIVTVKESCPWCVR